MRTIRNKKDEQSEQILKEVKQLESRLDARERGSHTLKARQQIYLDAGKTPENITYGMLCEGFESLGGIPDEFMSAEDPADRVTLWNERQGENEIERRSTYKSRCSCGGSCSSCDPTYTD